MDLVGDGEWRELVLSVCAIGLLFGMAILLGLGALCCGTEAQGWSTHIEFGAGCDIESVQTWLVLLVGGVFQVADRDGVCQKSLGQEVNEFVQALSKLV